VPRPLFKLDEFKNSSGLEFECLFCAGTLQITNVTNDLENPAQARASDTIAVAKIILFTFEPFS
jgi:hypothetical protein